MPRVHAPNLFSQPVQRFLVGAARITFRAFPQAKTSSGPNLSEVHEVLITGTIRNSPQLIPILTSLR